MQALFYDKLAGNKVKCLLCPHNCLIKEGDSGICKVRINQKGTLNTYNYGLVSSMGFDPIEKKPLYHFYPGSEILSIGSIGCNLQCVFCQNWEISQSSTDDFGLVIQNYNTDSIIKSALFRKNNIGIAYTYNEPTVFFEFMMDVARKASENNLKNVMVTNGFINLEPLNDLHQYMDAYNVDLKAFREIFFKEYTKSKLEPVKDALMSIVKAGKHLEITNLVIPKLNDDTNEFESMVKWIKENLGENVVLHISRYFPNYKLSKNATSIEMMRQLYSIAKQYLKYVYLGNVNVSDGNNTYCPNCKKLLIKRNGYLIKAHSINKKGNCTTCGEHVFQFITNPDEN